MNTYVTAVIGIILALIVQCADYDQLDNQAPAPVAVSIIGATDSTVTLRWSQCTAIDFKCYMVYRDTADISDTHAILVDTLMFSRDTIKVVRGLADSVRHHFRVFVKNTGGMISASNSVDTILYDRHTAAITLFRPDPVVEGPVGLRWTRGDSTGILRYLVYADTGLTVDSSDILVAITQGDTFTSIKGLRPDREYLFRVYGDKGSGPLVVSNAVSVRTSSGMPTSLTLDVNRVNDTSVTLGWNESPDTDFGFYAVFFDTTAKLDSLRVIDSRDKRIRIISKQTDTTLEITGLTGGVRYSFRVYNVDKSGQLAGSNVDTAMVPAKMPAASILSVKSVSDTTVTLGWTRTSGAGVYSYRLYMDTVALVDTTGHLKFETRDSLVHESTIGSLSRLRQYWFVLYTMGVNRLGAKSNVVVNYPFILFRATAADSAVALGWKSSINPRFMAYKVFRDTISGVCDTSTALTPKGIADRMVTDYIDSSVVSGRTYHYRVYEYDSVGVFSGSNILKATTP